MYVGDELTSPGSLWVCCAMGAEVGVELVLVLAMAVVWHVKWRRGPAAVGLCLLAWRELPCDD